MIDVMQLGLGGVSICRTPDQRIWFAMMLREAAVANPRGGKFSPLYHVTTPDKVGNILQHGFKDFASGKSCGDRVTYRFDPGVWLADAPPITAISVDQFLGHADDAWIEVLATPQFYEDHMVGNEWQDETWPTRQWLIPAVSVNALVRREVGLAEVLRLRLADHTTEHHRYCSAALLREAIQDGMTGDVRGRWEAALAEACAA